MPREKCQVSRCRQQVARRVYCGNQDSRYVVCAGWNGAPLFVVDGIIGGTYNPNDVESITVLKDAGAVALYGSRREQWRDHREYKTGIVRELRINYKGTIGRREIHYW